MKTTILLRTYPRLVGTRIAYSEWLWTSTTLLLGFPCVQCPSPWGEVARVDARESQHHLNLARGCNQRRVYIHDHCGITPPKTILIMVLVGAENESSRHEPSTLTPQPYFLGTHFQKSSTYGLMDPLGTQVTRTEDGPVCWEGFSAYDFGASGFGAWGLRDCVRAYAYTHTYVCMYVCMHVCMHGRMYACMYVGIRMYACMYVGIYIYTHMHACTYVCMYVCMYVHMYVCMHVCMHGCMYACMYVGVYIYTYTHMHACTYIFMYVCMYVCLYVCTYVCMYVCMYICMYVCM